MKEMDISRSSKRLKNTTHEETKDLISELPDHILVHILSFLPTQDAVKTVLLRRFGNLWRSVPVLDLDGCLYHECWIDGDITPDHEFKFGDVIRHVSNLHEAGVLDKLRLEYLFYLAHSNKESQFYDPDTRDYAEREKATAGHIDQLVGYAINKKVKVLDLNFRGCCILIPSEFYVLPDVFRSNYLADVRLVCCSIKSCRDIRLKALRVLSLDEVSLSDEIMENILLGCPFLEDLSLINCYGLSKLYCKNPNLKKLRLSLNQYQETLHVSCPHVMSLKLAGWIQNATSILDISSVIDASISVSLLFGSKQRILGDVQRLLQMIPMCKTLTLCESTILVLTLWNLSDVPCASYQWRNLIIQLTLTDWHHPGLCWLLKSSRSLETLTMDINRGYPGLFKTAAMWISYDPDFESYYWDVQEARFPFLECITIHGYVNEPYVDQMLKFLLKNATKLQKIVISIKKISKANRCNTGKKNDECYSCQVEKLVQELSTFPRASSRVMIYVSF